LLVYLKEYVLNSSLTFVSLLSTIFSNSYYKTLLATLLLQSHNIFATKNYNIFKADEMSLTG